MGDSREELQRLLPEEEDSGEGGAAAQSSHTLADSVDDSMLIHYKHCYLAAVLTQQHLVQLGQEKDDPDNPLKPAVISEANVTLYNNYLKLVTSSRKIPKKNPADSHMLAMGEAKQIAMSAENIAKGKELFEREAPKSLDGAWGGFGEFGWNMVLSTWYNEAFQVEDTFIAAAAAGGWVGCGFSIMAVGVVRASSYMYGLIPANAERAYVENVQEKNRALECMLVDAIANKAGLPEVGGGPDFKPAEVFTAAGKNVGDDGRIELQVCDKVFAAMMTKRVNTMVENGETYKIVRKGHLAFQGAYFIGTVSELMMETIPMVARAMMLAHPIGWAWLLGMAAVKGAFVGCCAGRTRYELLQSKLKNDFLIKEFEKNDWNTSSFPPSDMDFSKASIDKAVQKDVDAWIAGRKFEGEIPNDVDIAVKRKEILLTHLKKNKSFVDLVKARRKTSKHYKLQKRKNIRSGIMIGAVTGGIVFLCDPIFGLFSQLRNGGWAMYAAATAVSSVVIFGLVGLAIKVKQWSHRKLDKEHALGESSVARTPSAMFGDHHAQEEAAAVTRAKSKDSDDGEEEVVEKVPKRQPIPPIGSSSTG